MSDFIVLNEIMNPMPVPVTQPVFIRSSSINVLKPSRFNGINATQVVLPGDCVWVTETPDEITKIMELEHSEFMQKFGLIE